MPVITRAQRGDGNLPTAKPGDVFSIAMLQPSAVQREEDKYYQAPYQAPNPVSNTLNPITEMEEQHELGASSGGMEGVDGAGAMFVGEQRQVATFGPKYTMPTFEYLEDYDAEDLGWDDFGEQLGRDITYEELVPKGQRVTMDSLAKLIWNTKVDIRKDMLSMHDSMCKWQNKTVTRIEHVESNQKLMCEIMQQIETSQTENSDVVLQNTKEIEVLTKEFGKAVATINGLKQQIGRLTLDTNQHQRNFNEFNLRIHNMKSPIQARMAGTGRESTLDLVIDMFLTNIFISISKDELKTKITAAFRVGTPRIGKPRCTLVKFNCVRTRNIIFQSAMAKQKEIRRVLREEKKKPDKDSVVVTEDMTPLDMKEKELLQPMIDEFTKEKKPAYYTKGKIIITNQGRVRQELINEFLTKSQLRPIHVQPDFHFEPIERGRNLSAPSGPGQVPETYNRFTPLFSDYFMEQASKARGRGRANNRSRGQRPGQRASRW